ncbi:MAG: hypothetical protein EBQ85_04960 [Proteobacteria bacterium]|nr:hypothetical protein [Pseudomonadota bacterium]
MFLDEKTTELDLNPVTRSRSTSTETPRWTEHRTPQMRTAPASSTAVIEEKHFPWLIKLAAAVSILILSLWLF